jgi:hypothetical protein
LEVEKVLQSHFSARRWLLALAMVPAGAVLASPASAGAASVGQATSHWISRATSTNWSGYASTGGPFTSVSASWVEPTAKCTSVTTYSSFWVGIDGDGSNSVEQNGTDVDCHGGTAKYYAWYEMYPNPSVSYKNVVKPGDHFTASVTDSRKTFTLKISDVTQGWTQTQTKTSSIATKHSAEVVAESPELCNATTCHLAKLTNFGTVNFTASLANGTALGSHSPDAITMVTSTGIVRAKPGALSSGKNFSIVWHHV